MLLCETESGCFYYCNWQGREGDAISNDRCLYQVLVQWAVGVR